MTLKKNTDTKNKVQNYVKYSGMVFQMIGIIGLFAFIGYKLDNYYQSKTPIYTAFLSLTGVLISLYTVIKSLKQK
ncbi:MAG: AtpZ/AtpI family protein [Sphingobacteriales bacterium]|nr:MAG: AtpZ/AtpI family protein [Sphingobacteriales bacterium]